MAAPFYTIARETGLANRLAAFVGDRLGHDARSRKLYLPDGTFDTDAAFRLLAEAATLDGGLSMDAFVEDNLPDGFSGFTAERDCLRRILDGTQERDASEGLLDGHLDKTALEIRLRTLERFLFLEAASAFIDRRKGEEAR